MKLFKCNNDVVRIFFFFKMFWKKIIKYSFVLCHVSSGSVAQLVALVECSAGTLLITNV